MSGQLTEEEQIEQIKHFAKTYGPSIILGILLALVGSYAWRSWHARRLHMYQASSSAYEQMLGTFAADEDKDARTQADFITQNFKRSPYASLAALRVAREDVEQKKYAQAKQQLQWVIDNANQEALKVIATLRQARVLLAEEKWQAAIDLVGQVQDKAYYSAKETVLAQAYLGMKDKQKAHQAYTAALAALPKRAIIKPMLEMHANDLALTDNT